MDVEVGEVKENENPRSDISFRSIDPKDLGQLKELHNSLFPVKYSDTFFDDVVHGRGMKGNKLFTSIALQQCSIFEEMIGFIIGQFISSSDCEDTTDLFEDGSESKEVFYIMTFGLKKGIRRLGIGSLLLQHCITHATSNPICGAVIIPFYMLLLL
jgi:ribosomal protein S18 acetylase RimI-like enzyme